MSNGFDTTNTNSNPIREHWLPIKIAVDKVLAFEESFNNEYLSLACHAALPFILTPELVNLIRINFLDNKNLDWCSEADFLLSPLCFELEDGIYQIEPSVREVLLVELDRNFGCQRPLELAAFLLTYLAKKPDRTLPTQLTQLQRWIAESFFDPDAVVKQMTEILEASDTSRKNLANQIQVITAIEILSDSLKFAISYKTLAEKSRNLACVIYSYEERIGDKTSEEKTVLLEHSPVVKFINPKKINLGFKSQYTIAINKGDLTLPIKNFAWSPKDSLLAMVSINGYLFVIDSIIKNILWAKTLEQEITAICWSPDNQLIALGTDKGIIRLLEAQTGKTQKTFLGHTDSIYNVHWLIPNKTDYKLVSCSADKSVKQWDIVTGEINYTNRWPISNLKIASWMPNGSTLASSFEDKDIDTSFLNGNKWYNKHTHSFYERVSCINWSVNGQYLLVGLLNGDVIISALSTQQNDKPFIFRGHTKQVTSIAISSDNKFLASKSLDNTIHLWSVDNQEQLLQIESKTIAQQQLFTGLAFHSKLPILAALSENDSVLNIWELDIAQLLTNPKTNLFSKYNFLYTDIVKELKDTTILQEISDKMFLLKGLEEKISNSLEPVDLEEWKSKNNRFIHLLEKGYETWNSWRATNSDEIIDLNQQNLSNYDFKLNFINFNGVNLKEADLSDIDLTKAEINSADLSGAILNTTKLNSASLSNAKLIKAQLQRNTISNANFSSVDFSGCDLADTTLENVILDKANFTRANLNKTQLINCKLEGTDFTESYWSNTKLSDINLSKVKGLDKINHSNTSTLCFSKPIDLSYLSQEFLGHCQIEINCSYLRRLAVLCGIDKYKNNRFPNLLYPTKDIDLLSKVLRENLHEDFRYSQVIINTNEAVTLSALRNTLSNLRDSSTDELLFCLSGHGHRVEQKCYFLTYEASLTNPGISLDELADLFQLVSASKIFILLDFSCSDYFIEKIEKIEKNNGDFAKKIIVLAAGHTAIDYPSLTQYFIKALNNFNIADENGYLTWRNVTKETIRSSGKAVQYAPIGYSKNLDYYPVNKKPDAIANINLLEHHINVNSQYINSIYSIKLQGKNLSFLIKHFAWASKGSLLAIVSTNGYIAVLNSMTKTILWEKTVEQEFTAISWLLDNKLIALGTNKGNIYLLETDTGSHHKLLDGHSDTIYGLQWVARDKINYSLFSCSADKTIREWDIETFKTIYTYQWLISNLQTISWIPNWDTFATISNDKAIRVWHRDGNAWYVDKNYEGTSVCWSLDNKHIVISLLNGDIVLRPFPNEKSEDELIFFKGHKKQVNGLALSADGKFLASKSLDNTIRLWSIDEQKQLLEIESQTIGQSLFAGLIFHPQLPILAFLSETDTTLNIAQLDTQQIKTPIDALFDNKIIDLESNVIETVKELGRKTTIDGLIGYLNEESSIFAQWRVADILVNIAIMDMKKAQYNLAVELLDDSLVIYKKLLKMDSHDDLKNTLAVARMNKGNALQQIGKLPEALIYHKNATKILKLIVNNDYPKFARNLIAALSNQGNTLNALGKFAKAISCFNEAINLSDSLLSKSKSEELVKNLILLLNNIGEPLRAIGCFLESIVYYDKAITLISERESKDLIPTLAAVLMNKGIALTNLKRFPEAINSLDNSIALYKDLIEQETTYELTSNIALAFMSKGITLGEFEKPTEAISCYDDAIIRLEHLVKVRGHSELENDLASALNNKGTILNKLDKSMEAINLYDEAIRIRKKLVEKENRQDLVSDLAAVLMNKGFALANLNSFDEANVYYDEAINLYTRLVYNEGRTDLENTLAKAFVNKADTIYSLGQFQECISYYDKAIDIRNRLVADERIEATELAIALTNKGVALTRLYRISEAFICHEKATNHYKNLLEKGNSELKESLAKSLIPKGEILILLKKFPEAIDCYDEAIDILDDLLVENFKITNQFLDRLKAENISDSILNKLESLKEQQFIGENNFFSTLKTLLGDEDTIKIQALITKYTEKNEKLELIYYLAMALRNKGSAQQEIKQFSTATMSYDRAISICKPIEYKSYEVDKTLAEILSNKGRILFQQNMVIEGLNYFDDSIIICRRLLEKNDHEEAINLTMSLCNKGIILMNFNSLQEAKACFEEAIVWREKSVKAGRKDFLPQLIFVMRYLFIVLTQLNQFEEATTILNNIKESCSLYTESNIYSIKSLLDELNELKTLLHTLLTQEQFYKEFYLFLDKQIQKYSSKLPKHLSNFAEARISSEILLSREKQEKLDSLKVELEESKKLHSEVISLLTKLHEELMNIDKTIKQIGEKFSKGSNKIKQLQKAKLQWQKSQEFKLAIMELTNHINHSSKAITKSSNVLEDLLNQAIGADTRAIFITSNKEQAQESAKNSISLWQTINNGCLNVKNGLELFSKPIETYAKMQISIFSINFNNALKNQMLANTKFNEVLEKLSSQATKAIAILNKFLTDPDSVLP